jgi:DNA mismatch endonuclease (patch repair protein)
MKTATDQVVTITPSPDNVAKAKASGPSANNKFTWEKTARSRSLVGRRSRDTAPELRLRKALHSVGLRFRLFQKIPGTRLSVDIILPRHRLAIFCDGCFWHSHDCRDRARIVASGVNANAWSAKMAEIKIREHRAENALQRLGFDVLRFWECEIASNIAGVLGTVLTKTRDNKKHKIEH